MSKFSNTSVSIDLSARSPEIKNHSVTDNIAERVQAAMERANIGLDEKTAARLEELIALGEKKKLAYQFVPGD